MGKYFTGHIPDPPAVVARRKGFHILKAKRGLGVAPLPLKTNNRAKLLTALGGPGILNQKDTGSCVGHAIASAITLRFALMGKPIPLVSPVGVYDVARMISRSPNADGSLPPLSDDGTEPNLAYSGLAEWGACSAATWGDYPATSATINDEPTPQDMMLTADFKLSGAYFLDGTAGDQYLRDLMTALAAAYPLSYALAASNNTFQGYTGGVLGPMDDAVDHENYLIDYEWDGSNLSSLIVYGTNSWSEGWGESDVVGIGGGMYRANRQFIAKYSDSTAVVDVSAIGSEQ